MLINQLLEAIMGSGLRKLGNGQILLNAFCISFTEYRNTTGRPCGQLIGHSVFASSLSSHSILFCSSGILILMAAWQAMLAAIFALIFSRFNACSSRWN